MKQPFHGYNLQSWKIKCRSGSVNAARKRSGALYSFVASISGEFPEKSFPTEHALTLKKGAQVMFIKNDTGEDRRYFNGKLAVVKSIDREEIAVEFEDGQSIIIEKETWKKTSVTIIIQKRMNWEYPKRLYTGHLQLLRKEVSARYINYWASK